MEPVRLVVKGEPVLTGATQAERRLILLRGEIEIETARDPAAVPRPFVVATRDAWLRPLGTRFVVRHLADAGWIGVTEGAVAVRPARATETERVIAAGQSAGFTALRVDAPNPLPDTATAWTEGMLVADDMRLDAFLAEVKADTSRMFAMTPPFRVGPVLRSFRLNFR